MLTILLAGLSLAQAEPADIRIELSGSGRWEVSCTFETEDGPRSDRGRGRGLSDFDDIRARAATAGECAVEARERARVLVRIAEADGFACPFDADAGAEDCQRTFVGPASDRFALQTER